MIVHLDVAPELVNLLLPTIFPHPRHTLQRHPINDSLGACVDAQVEVTVALLLGGKVEELTAILDQRIIIGKWVPIPGLSTTPTQPWFRLLQQRLALAGPRACGQYSIALHSDILISIPLRMQQSMMHTTFHVHLRVNELPLTGVLLLRATLPAVVCESGRDPGGGEGRGEGALESCGAGSDLGDVIAQLVVHSAGGPVLVKRQRPARREGTVCGRLPHLRRLKSSLESTQLQQSIARLGAGLVIVLYDIVAQNNSGQQSGNAHRVESEK
mmetsp:Transcript_23883/g.57909  ORF Transcript_23883/g.57909 Transcript_23883/m.57909 type:complete len:270 (-) Transcript_23883:86-895(-)